MSSATLTDAVSLLTVSIDLLSTKDNAVFSWGCQPLNQMTSQCPFIAGEQRERFNEHRSSNYKVYVARIDRSNDRRGRLRRKSYRKEHAVGWPQRKIASVNDQRESAGTNSNTRGEAKYRRSGQFRRPSEKISPSAARQLRSSISPTGTLYQPMGRKEKQQWRETHAEGALHRKYHKRRYVGCRLQTEQ